MPLPSPQRRDSDGRAVRLVGGLVLTLAVGVTAAGLLGARLGVWGPDAGRQRSRRGAAGDRGAATGPAERSASEAARTPTVRGAQDPGAVGPDPARGPDGGPGAGDGHRDPPRAEDLLSFLDHMESRIAAVVERARESVVALEYTASEAPAGKRRVASGVVINDRGEILSVRIDPPPADPAGGAGKRGGDPHRIVARDYLGRAYPARWLASDPHTGLTLLRVRRGAVRPIRAMADGPKLGSQVFVLGNPFGLGHSVHRGYVAGLDRVLELGPRQLGGLIQVQASLYPGDNGAAVVDVRGGWLGLIRSGLAVPGAVARPATSSAPEPAEADQPSARAADHRDAPNDLADRTGDAEADPSAEPDSDFGFAIPTRDALWIAEQLRTHRRVDRAYLGVRLEEMPISQEAPPTPEPAPSTPGAASSSAFGPGAPGSWRGVGGSPDPSDAPPAATEDADSPPSGEGARILQVMPDTPAARAGLRAGDRIVALDGRPIRSRSDLIDRLDRIPARKTIVLGIIRGDEPTRPRREVAVRTASRPDPSGSSAGPPPGPRSGGASVQVTPTASRVEPAAPAATSGGSNPSPPAAGGSRPSPATPDEARPGPSPPPPQPSTPRPDATPAPAPAAPDRPESPPPAADPSPSLSELKLALPRAVVERIEHLERRIIELEQFRSAAGTGTAGLAGGDAPARAPAPNPERERAGRPPRRSPP